MCLSVACALAYSVPTRIGGGGVVAADADVAQAAARAFFRLGGQPHYERPQSNVGGMSSLKNIY